MSAVPAKPTSVVMAMLRATFARIPVPILVRESCEPLGSSTCGVTERPRVGVKLMEAAAKAGESGRMPAAGTGICPNDRFNGALPVVVSVRPRTGDASAGPASAPARMTAGICWSPRLDATETPPRSRSGIWSRSLFTLGPLPSSVKEKEGNVRPRSVAGLGLTASKLIREVAIPELRGATVVDITASWALATGGAITARRASAATTTPVRSFRRRVQRAPKRPAPQVVRRSRRQLMVCCADSRKTRPAYRGVDASPISGKGGSLSTAGSLRVTAPL